MNDPFGVAIEDYFRYGKADDILVDSNYTEDEKIPVSWLFREHNKMPKIEKRALKECTGKVLDIGAAAGCHSVILQKNGMDTTALEISPLACEVLKKRGIRKVVCSDIYQYQKDKFDTILLLMNGAGLGQTLNGLGSLLHHIKKLLLPEGQVLIDSSDIKYLFQEEDGSFWIDMANLNYYGEMEYHVRYRNHSSRFKWLFIDYNNLSSVAENAGLHCEKLLDGEHHDYLARLYL